MGTRRRSTNASSTAATVIVQPLIQLQHCQCPIRAVHTYPNQDGPTTIYVENLGPEIDPVLVNQLFLPFGIIKSMRVIWKCYNDSIAIIEYYNQSSAENAILNRNGLLVRDRVIKVVSFPDTTTTSSGGGGGVTSSSPSSVQHINPLVLNEDLTSAGGGGAAQGSRPRFPNAYHGPGHSNPRAMPNTNTNRFNFQNPQYSPSPSSAVAVMSQPTQTQQQSQLQPAPELPLPSQSSSSSFAPVQLYPMGDAWDEQETSNHAWGNVRRQN